MNEVKAIVIKVIKLPEERTIGEKKIWIVEVYYNCYGRRDYKKLSFNTKEEAEKVEKGYIFYT